MVIIRMLIDDDQYNVDDNDDVDHDDDDEAEDGWMEMMLSLLLSLMTRVKFLLVLMAWYGLFKSPHVSELQIHNVDL